ncbi:DMT family protein [Sphingomonas naphthae]|uniref:DMT family protein n=1 Tax=Sphingomonas naphthae TaxID=1813468 RepID=A0ABY7TT15_9SPHN|nr:DMT family protein [Sphingomonas naphthae]WCT75359.1 DMT family protein [Sphingomonas naphthae]
MTTFLLLCCSNLFMTIAWYGHLKMPAWPVWLAVLVSWGIALVEYCFAVPANRIGYAAGFSGGQLKIMQECITLVVFALFAIVVLKEPLTWRYAGAFACILGAAGFLFAGKGA